MFLKRHALLQPSAAGSTCAEPRRAVQQVAVLSLGTGCTIMPALLDPSQAGVLSWLNPGGADLVSLLMSGAQELSTSLLAAELQAVRCTVPERWLACAASCAGCQRPPASSCAVHSGAHSCLVWSKAHSAGDMFAAGPHSATQWKGRAGSLPCAVCTCQPMALCMAWV